jgi:hypothetical protein
MKIFVAAMLMLPFGTTIISQTADPDKLKQVNASTPQVSQSPAPVTITTLDGQVFQKAVISAIAPDGLVITHEVGVATIKFTQLPEDLRKQYGYDPAKAKAFEETEAVAAASREVAAREFYAEQKRKLEEAQREQEEREQEKKDKQHKKRLALGIGMYGPGRYHWTELPTSSHGSSSFGEWQAQNKLDHAIDDYNRAARDYNSAVQKDVFPQIDH